MNGVWIEIIEKKHKRGLWGTGQCCNFSKNTREGTSMMMGIRKGSIVYSPFGGKGDVMGFVHEVVPEKDYDFWKSMGLKTVGREKLRYVCLIEQIGW